MLPKKIRGRHQSIFVAPQVCDRVPATEGAFSVGKVLAPTPGACTERGSLLGGSVRPAGAASGAPYWAASDDFGCHQHHRLGAQIADTGIFCRLTQTSHHNLRCHTIRGRLPRNTLNCKEWANVTLRVRDRDDSHCHLPLRYFLWHIDKGPATLSGGGVRISSLTALLIALSHLLLRRA